MKALIASLGAVAALGWGVEQGRIDPTSYAKRDVTMTAGADENVFFETPAMLPEQTRTSAGTLHTFRWTRHTRETPVGDRETQNAAATAYCREFIAPASRGESTCHFSAEPSSTRGWRWDCEGTCYL